MFCTLKLPGLSSVRIKGIDENAGAAVRAVARYAELSGSPSSDLEILVSSRLADLPAGAPVYVLGALRFAHRDSQTVCVIDVGRRPGFDETLSCIFQLVALLLQREGALLLHGALAERGGQGVLMAAPSGTGKSTASRRLPAPWLSLCDDMAMITGSGAGGFTAHPWPTMSEIREGRGAPEWQVEKGVSLDGIFLLEQSSGGGLQPLGGGAALCSLVHVDRQGSWLIDETLGNDGIAERRLKRFDRLADLAAAVPAFRLKLTLDDPFWENIEGALASLSKGIPAGVPC